MKVITGVKQLDSILESLRYGGDHNVIGKKEGYTLVKPSNTYDSNYKLYSDHDNCTYLVDIGDIHETVEELEESGGILKSELYVMDITAIKAAAWIVKTEK